MFERYRKARAASLLLPPLVVALLGWVLAHKVVDTEWLRFLESITRGVITPACILALVATGVIIALAALGGGIQLDDLGLNRDHVGRGVGIVLMIWGAGQVLGVLPRVVANRAVQLAHDFEYGSRWEMAGQFLTALSTSTAEEIALRGFLLVQLYLWFNRGDRNGDRGLVPALVVSVVVSALVALPAVLPYPSLEVAIVDQVTRLVVATLLSWLYIQTRNLFFIIGVHTLIIAPSAIVAGPQRTANWFHPLVIAILAGVWGLLWPRRD